MMVKPLRKPKDRIPLAKVKPPIIAANPERAYYRRSWEEIATMIQYGQLSPAQQVFVKDYYYHHDGLKAAYLAWNCSSDSTAISLSWKTLRLARVRVLLGEPLRHQRLGNRIPEHVKRSRREAREKFERENREATSQAQYCIADMIAERLYYEKTITNKEFVQLAQLWFLLTVSDQDILRHQLHHAALSARTYDDNLGHSIRSPMEIYPPRKKKLNLTALAQEMEEKLRLAKSNVVVTPEDEAKVEQLRAKDPLVSERRRTKAKRLGLIAEAVNGEK